MWTKSEKLNYIIVCLFEMFAIERKEEKNNRNLMQLLLNRE